MEKDDKIFVAGHKGLIGSAVIRRFQLEGYHNLLLFDHATIDLTDAGMVEGLFRYYNPKYVILAAGKVGGIIANQEYPADFITANLAIQLNVIKSARRFNVRRLIFFGSSCMYPRECPQPMSESLLLTGLPESTSLSYAIAKLAGIQMCLSYNQQYGQKRFIPVIPNSAYGPNDNFDPKNSHVLSGLIRRFHEAVQDGSETVTLWGSGTPRREFVYADDIADACLYLLTSDLSNLKLPVNVGIGKDCSIRELAETIASVIGYTGKMEWDISKPDGAPRKLLDSSRMISFGWKPQIDLVDGVRKTYGWYLENLNTSKPDSERRL